MDLSYWENYYKSHQHNATNSLFSEFVLKNYLRDNDLRCKPRNDNRLESVCTDSNLALDNIESTTAKDSDTHTNSNSKISRPKELPTTHTNSIKLLELGCGNGRDSVYFAKNAIHTTAIDQVQNEIDYLNARFGNKSCVFVCGDFSLLSQLDSLTPPYDCIYSRFSLHSITHAQQRTLLTQLPHYLAIGGILAIETRGKKNSLYKKGKVVQKECDAFIYEAHYRRFVDLADLCNEIESISPYSKAFKILYAKEARGFAPFVQNGKKEDDFFIRIVARLVDSSEGGATKYYIILKQPTKDSCIIIESKVDSSNINFLDSHIAMDFIITSCKSIHFNATPLVPYKEAV